MSRHLTVIMAAAFLIGFSVSLGTLFFGEEPIDTAEPIALEDRNIFPFTLPEGRYATETRDTTPSLTRTQYPPRSDMSGRDTTASRSGSTQSTSGNTNTSSDSSGARTTQDDSTSGSQSSSSSGTASSESETTNSNSGGETGDTSSGSTQSDTTYVPPPSSSGSGSSGGSPSDGQTSQGTSESSTTDTADTSDTTQTEASSHDAQPGTLLLVDFGAEHGANTFGLEGWTAYLGDSYTRNHDIGPGGSTIDRGGNPAYNYQGVAGSSAYTFNADDQITVTWHNASSEPVTFTPRITFEDEDRPTGSDDYSSTGEWYDMSSVTLEAGSTQKSTYTFSESVAGPYRVVGVNVNHSNVQELVADKIELVSPTAPEPTLVTTEPSDSSDSQASDTSSSDDSGDTTTPSAPNPVAVGEVSNPNSGNHPFFTSMVNNADAHNVIVAESWRFDGTEAQEHAYYAARTGPRGRDSNPYASYDPVQEGVRIDTIEGEKALPFRYQLRTIWPEVGPEHTDTLTIQWEARFHRCGWHGGKAFQIANKGGSDIHIELQAGPGYEGQVPCELPFARSTSIRTYDGPDVVGGLGASQRLVCCAEPGKINNGAQQPALGHLGRTYTPGDHIGSGGDAFLWRAEVWTTFRAVLDWKSSPHRLELWMKDENTPWTLVVGEGTEAVKSDGTRELACDSVTGRCGFKLQWTHPDGGYHPYYTNIGGFWIEQNNSSTLNATDSSTWTRNLLVATGALPFE